jgi:glucose/arabinose dehydrogenase
VSKWRFSVILGALGLVLGLVVPLTAQQDDGKMEPFLQSDFKVLTGDVQRPNGIYWYDGYLYTGCAGDYTLYRLHDETGETITYIYGVKNTHSLYVEMDEEKDEVVVWAADFQDNQLDRAAQSTGLVAVREGLAAPWGLTPSATDDTFFITEWQSDNLINISRDGKNIRVVASGFADPSGVVATEDRLYVANNASARRAVEWLDLTADASARPQALVSGLQNVTNLVMGPDGLLYIAYALGTRGVVGRVDPLACELGGGCTNVDVELVVWTELPAPLAGLVITPEMRLYVHTQYGSEIYWLDLPPAGTAMSN